jgi:hypothetical protein
MSKTTRIVEIHTVPFLKGLQWHIKVNGRRVSRFTNQSNAEACAIFLARLMPSATVKAHTGNGRIKWERTYPKSADPAKTKG